MGSWEEELSSDWTTETRKKWTLILEEDGIPGISDRLGGTISESFCRVPLIEYPRNEKRNNFT